MFKSPHTPLGNWPAIAAAVAYGIVEWLALSRSRALDHLAGWRLAFSRR